MITIPTVQGSFLFYIPRYVPLIPNMTSNTTPYGTASALLTAFNQPWDAFTNGNSNYWGFGGNSSSLSYTFASASIVNQTSFNAQVNIAPPFTNVFIQVTPDGVNWNTVASLISASINALTFVPLTASFKDVYTLAIRYNFVSQDTYGFAFFDVQNAQCKGYYL